MDPEELEHEEDEWARRHLFRVGLSMRSRVLALGTVGLLCVGLVTLNIGERISDAWGTMVLSKLLEDAATSLGPPSRVPAQPVCEAWRVERPSRPPEWYQQGYGFVNHSIQCWVYYTADFARIDHVIEVEVLNQTIESMSLVLPYGSTEIRGPEGVFGSWTKGDEHDGPLVLEQHQTENQTTVIVSVTPETRDTTNLVLSLVYRVFDLTGFEGVYGFDETLREGNQRWEAGNHVSFSPGSFDEGTWKLVVEILGNSGRIQPIDWDPDDATQVEHPHDQETFYGIEWCYLGSVPQTPRFNATYRYTSVETGLRRYLSQAPK